MPDEPISLRYVWVGETPFPSIVSVKLGRERWERHIIAGHSEMTGKEENARKAVTSPTVIAKGQPNTQNVVFINHLDSTPKGSPIVVVVHRVSGEVVTALYDRRFAVVRDEDRLWPLP